ncbi:P-loop containing nucleoside triphosphate hydrolase protein [Epithele typhae]|uniref:P-loop containing nucleoside triphosphate hydrolase protein n=1 Tax=Epithele typhae TaxID=378194 RepID=UPI002008DAB4|nr:P-loop containing nucleoside triphosphate hydrolase protein [Epithele typhae]KAH9927435.1 P-loop containing nucleoside triphosphate hydrolase protein [Epithele typhae]
MEKTADELSAYLVGRLKDTPPDGRLLVGIAGVPASGKSTLSQLVVDRVNAQTRSAVDNVAAVHDPSSQPIAVYIGLDGWHLSRAQLDAFPDPKLAHDRRGAHWTFDGEGYVTFVRALRQPLAPSATVYAPSFSHENKDPVYDHLPVHPHHRLVLIEGLYTFLAIKPWSAASEMLDERWWVQVTEEEAENRLVTRHVRTGVAKDMDEAIWRSRENDAPNGRFIQENMMQPTRVIQSINDPSVAVA